MGQDCISLGKTGPPIRKVGPVDPRPTCLKCPIIRARAITNWRDEILNIQSVPSIHWCAARSILNPGWVKGIEVIVTQCRRNMPSLPSPQSSLIPYFPPNRQTLDLPPAAFTTFRQLRLPPVRRTHRRHGSATPCPFYIPGQIVSLIASARLPSQA